MREIKFRAWHKGEMYKASMCEYLSGYGLMFDHFTKPDALEQYTGMKDSEGVEIYEGDIVSAFSNVNKHTDPHLTDREPEFNAKEVEFRRGAFVLSTDEYEFCGVLGYNTSTMPDTLKVIGNIHEGVKV